jgi:hypothetical protein
MIEGLDTGPNPMTVSHNVTSSLVRFENKNVFFNLKKPYVAYYNATVVVIKSGVVFWLQV